MRKVMLFIGAALAVISFSFSPQKEKTAYRMPACYTYECMGSGCSSLAGWASATGAGMAMYGYTNVHYNEWCCDDACFHTCASMCGTPPPDFGGVAENDATTKTVSEGIAGLTKEQAKITGEQLASKAIKEGGMLKNISVSAAGILTLTYLVKK